MVGGLALFGLGLVLVLLPFWDIYLGDDHLGPLLLIFGGGYISGFGLALFARSLGASVFWCMTTIIPIIGPFVGLLGVVLNDAWKSWVKKKVERQVLPWKKVFAALVVYTIIFWGIVASALPNFLNYGARARQSEAKVNLGGVLTSATALKAENKTFVISDINQLRYMPSGSLRYSYWYAVNGVPTMIPGSSQAKSPCDVTTPPTTVMVAASATGFTAAAKGNMDADPTCDEWSINDAKVLTNTLDDVTH